MNPISILLRTTLTGLLIVIFLISPTSADSWMPPVPTFYASGSFGFRVVPKEGKVLKAIGTLYKLDLQGNFVTIWSRELVNMPVSAKISYWGSVVTFDTYYHEGYEHAVVIYGKLGEVIKDYKLDNLMSGAEIELADKSVSSRSWLDYRKIVFAFEGHREFREILIIHSPSRTDWRKYGIEVPQALGQPRPRDLRFDLNTGKISHRPAYDDI